jgi:hypothetical protein
MFTNQVVDQLKELNLPSETNVSLSYTGGCDCFVYNETEVETALEETDVVSVFANLVSTIGLNLTDNYGNNVIDSLVDAEHIERDFVNSCWDEDNEDYYDDDLSEAISEFVNDNFYDQEFIEKDVTKYDHKRGFIDLTARLKTTVGNVIETNVDLTGWEVSVPLAGGTFTLG